MKFTKGARSEHCLGRFCLGLFCFSRFCLGRFCFGRFCFGRYFSDCSFLGSRFAWIMICLGQKMLCLVVSAQAPQPSHLGSSSSAHTPQRSHLGSASSANSSKPSPLSQVISAQPLPLNLLIPAISAHAPQPILLSRDSLEFDPSHLTLVIFIRVSEAVIALARELCKTFAESLISWKTWLDTNASTPWQMPA